MTEKKEMTEEEKEEEKLKKLRFRKMYILKEYEDFETFAYSGLEQLTKAGQNLLLFNIFYQLTRIADYLREEKSPIN